MCNYFEITRNFKPLVSSRPEGNLKRNHYILVGSNDRSWCF